MLNIMTAPQDGGAEVPPREDGEEFQHVLLYGDNQMAFADRLGELIGLVIPDYDELPDTPSGDEEALIQRHRHLAGVANAVQADYNAKAVQRGLLDPNTTDENLLTATAHDRVNPWPGVLNGDDPRPSFNWDHPLPIVLIVTDYDPFVPSRSLPTGNVVLLDPSDEARYLESLTRLGLVTYMRRG